ncbi:hypothetical protein Dimus_005986 [Dionaea muscipula]
MDDSDWELVNNSDSGAGCSEEFPGGGDSESDDGIVRPDYFSVDSHQEHAAAEPESPSQQSSVGSSDPNWIDPGPGDTQAALHSTGSSSGELWSGHSSGDWPPATAVVGFGGMTELVGAGNNLIHSGSESGAAFACPPDPLVEETIDEAGEMGILGGGNTNSMMGGVSVVGEATVVNKDGDEVEINGGSGVMEEVISSSWRVKEREKEEEKMAIVWWKVPLELVKCCVLRASSTPVWSFSMAAAVMGLIILGRRLYNTKCKTQSQGLQLKVTLEDKKVAQLISHAARLNESFSVVRWVPVIRPSLPSQSGIAPWPVLSLR